MATMVVGIDGSSASAHALDWAAEHAALSGFDLELVHAIDLPSQIDFYGTEIVSPQIDALQSFADSVLGSAEQHLRQAYPELGVSTRSAIGTATGVLLAASESATVIVVGSRGLGAVSSAVMGSVSVRIASDADCPVFVIEDTDEMPDSGPIVVGVDDSESSVIAVGFALHQAALRKTNVRAVHSYHLPRLAIPVEQPLLDDLQSSQRDEALRVITSVVERAREAASAAHPDEPGVEPSLGGDDTGDIEVTPVAVESVVIADGLLEHSADAQLVVIGSHGKSLVRRLLLGSTSRRVLHDTQLPVAVVHPGRAGDSSQTGG